MQIAGYGETWVEKTSNTGLEFLPYKFTAKELDKETGLYYYGARYLDPKYSRWISADPALGEYIPQAPTDEEAKRNNQNLPGIGGVFNTVNASLYHYAGNNPVKYTDPDGRNIAVIGIVAFVAIPVLVIACPRIDRETAEASIEAISTAFSNAENYIEKNIEHYNVAKAKAKELAKDYTDKKSTGSYTITFESGKTYSGKGGIKRAIESAASRSQTNNTMPTAIDWTSAPTIADAFEDEYVRIQDHGGPMSRNFDKILNDPNYDHPNYNKIQSPGETIYLLRHGHYYD